MIMSFFKKIFLIVLVSYLDYKISYGLSKIYIMLPLTFLAYSYYLYKSDNNIGPLESFLTGLFVDLITNSYLGHNAILFCFASYLINTYANTFKLFSYLQICIFFGASATAYVGFSQIILNLYNFSYLTLFLSAIFNIIFCIFVSIFSVYFPSISSRKI
mgnify:FL=1